MYESLTVVSTSFWSTEKSVNMGTVLHDCLAHFSSKYVLKEEQRQAVLRLLEKKKMLWRFYPRVLGKVKFTNCSRQSNSNKEQKNVVRVASPLRCFIYD